MIELWRAGGSGQPVSADAARAVEAEGWDGQVFMDSQSLGADPYVLMGAWAVATERLKLATGVTNPLTRHVAVTAAGAASVQALSGGRAVLGIGRGDSALAYLGRRPVGLAAFGRALDDLQALLRGEEIAFGPDLDGEARSLDTMSLGARPEGTRLRWLDPAMPKVPLDVAATGPKVIEMAARVAEQVTFSVGASPERVRWALDVARAERARAGLPGEGVSYGAQIVVACHSDAEVALELATSFAAPLVRFQVIEGQAAGPGSASDAENFAAVRKGYDMTKHGVVNAEKRVIGSSLTPDFVRSFTIAGTPDHCVERLIGLMRCGLERFVIVGPGFYPESWGDARDLFVREAMPALRDAAGRERRLAAAS